MKYRILAAALAVAVIFFAVELAETAPPAGAQESDECPTPADDGSTTYRSKAGDSWWKIAHFHFKERGLSTRDIIAANPGVTILKPGTLIRIPAGECARPAPQHFQPRVRTTAEPRADNAGTRKYTIDIEEDNGRVIRVTIEVED